MMLRLALAPHKPIRAKSMLRRWTVHVGDRTFARCR